MRKIAYFIALFAIACLLAGTYGAVHNQISYTVSEEYFTKLKFAQFHIPETHQNRIGVSMVGWCASWWMGIVIGVILIPLGLVIPTAKRYFISMMKVLAIVCLTALVFAIGALIHGYVSFDADDLPSYRYPPNLQDKLAFARAGHMHNASYLGGFAGFATGGTTIFLLRRRKYPGTVSADPCQNRNETTSTDSNAPNTENRSVADLSPNQHRPCRN